MRYRKCGHCGATDALSEGPTKCRKCGKDPRACRSVKDGGCGRTPCEHWREAQKQADDYEQAVQKELDALAQR